ADPPAEQQQPPAAAPVAPATGTSKAPRPAPRRCVVPRLSGLTVTGARRALSRARCTLGKVTRRRSRKGRRGRVLRQGATPGARLKAGARVAVTVRR
ncbi:MAG: PASTA domain-containing protein, partial [Solirubrobacterales bacterium]|nr:PASTA domain-containing protein [Solirubrobacterales bacterium]